jgi:hypothetical protein
MSAIAQLLCTRRIEPWCDVFLTTLQVAVKLEQWVTEVATGVSPDDEELGNIHLYCVL